MIYYKVKHMVFDGDLREFDDAESAIKAAMSYDHEHCIYQCDSQDPTDDHVKFGYVHLNILSVADMASTEFVNAAQRVCSAWPFKLAKNGVIA